MNRYPGKISRYISILICTTLLLATIGLIPASKLLPITAFLSLKQILILVLLVIGLVTAGKINRTCLRFTEEQKRNNETKRRIALKWLITLRYGNVDSHFEYLKTKLIDPSSNQAKERTQLAAECMLLCAGKDGLSQSEKEWILGFFVACNTHDEVIQFIQNYTLPPESDDKSRSITSQLIKFYPKREKGILKNILYLSILAASADGRLSQEEKSQIAQFGHLWEIEKNQINELFQLCKEQEELQSRRKKCVYSEVLQVLEKRKEGMNKTK